MNNAFIGDLVVPVAGGATQSPALRIAGINQGIGIVAPASLDAVTWTIQVGYDVGGTVTWATLHDGSTDIAAPAAGKARIYLGFPFNLIRIAASGAVASTAKTFKVFAI